MSIPSKPDACGDGKQSEWDDGRDDYSKDGDKCDYSKHPKNDDRSDDGDCGKGDTHHNPGEALARFDFSHGDFGSHRADHSGDILGALASMSSDDALEYAIGQMGPADHFDAGHFDVAADTSHDTDA
jgi:hypothetical protein